MVARGLVGDHCDGVLRRVGDLPTAAAGLSGRSALVGGASRAATAGEHEREGSRSCRDAHSLSGTQRHCLSFRVPPAAMPGPDGASDGGTTRARRRSAMGRDDRASGAVMVPSCVRITARSSPPRNGRPRSRAPNVVRARGSHLLVTGLLRTMARSATAAVTGSIAVCDQPGIDRRSWSMPERSVTVVILTSAPSGCFGPAPVPTDIAWLSPHKMSIVCTDILTCSPRRPRIDRDRACAPATDQPAPTCEFAQHRGPAASRRSAFDAIVTQPLRNRSRIGIEHRWGPVGALRGFGLGSKGWIERKEAQ